MNAIVIAIAYAAGKTDRQFPRLSDEEVENTLACQIKLIGKEGVKERKSIYPFPQNTYRTVFNPSTLLLNKSVKILMTVRDRTLILALTLIPDCNGTLRPFTNKY